MGDNTVYCSGSPGLQRTYGGVRLWAKNTVNRTCVGGKLDDYGAARKYLLQPRHNRPTRSQLHRRRSFAVTRQRSPRSRAHYSVRHQTIILLKKLHRCFDTGVENTGNWLRGLRCLVTAKLRRRCS
jgi:hypothetical protein